MIIQLILDVLPCTIFNTTPEKILKCFINNIFDFCGFIFRCVAVALINVACDSVTGSQ